MVANKKVVWRDGLLETGTLRPRELIREHELLPENADRAERLILGSLWTLTGHAAEMAFHKKTVKPPIPYLVGAYWPVGTGIFFKRGTIAVYFGTTRVEEMNKGSIPVRVPRHTFIIEGGRYMTNNLNLFAPV